MESFDAEMRSAYLAQKSRKKLSTFLMCSILKSQITPKMQRKKVASSLFPAVCFGFSVAIGDTYMYRGGVFSP